MNFSTFDTIIFAIIATSSLLGMYRGLINFTISLVSFILSILSAYFLYPFTSSILTNYLSNNAIIAILSGIISYIISLFILGLLSKKLLLVIEDITGGVVDRLFGLIAGFARGAIVCWILFIVIMVFSSQIYFQSKNIVDIFKYTNNAEQPKLLEKSISVEYLMRLNNAVILLMPSDMSEITLPKINNTSSDIMQKLDNIETNKPNSELDNTVDEEIRNFLSK